MADEYVPVAPVAVLFKVSPKTVARWSSEGVRMPNGTMTKVPCVLTLGGHRRYSKAAINELAETLGITERL
jgi:hypothetical protein